MIKPLLVCGAVMFLASCMAEDTEGPLDKARAAVPTYQLPDFSAPFDVQLAEQYTPPDGVRTLLLDRSFAPVPGTYNICYINALQTQEGEKGIWKKAEQKGRTNLVLRDKFGKWLPDPNTRYAKEFLLDISSRRKRAAIIRVIRPWILECVADGFDAVDFDNLDSYNRSGGRLSEDDAVRFISALNSIVHEHGLPVAQKNAPGLLPRLAETRPDFAIVESCSWDKLCKTYVEAFGDRVLMIEFDGDTFDDVACPEYGRSHSIIQRDLDFLSPEKAARKRADYVFKSC